MKHFLLLAFVTIILSSCGKDDCSLDTFLGTLFSTKTCAGFTTFDVVIIATKSGDNVVLNGDIFVDETLKRDGCSLEGGENALGVGTFITANVSEDGKSMTINYEVKGAGVSVEKCTYKINK
ncbi:MAG TPA: hypothetical protein VK169_05085 [Saprospiraceae bacterium]|nr:hypothetical protein [Saprospiraceae bacterium]